MNTNPIIIRGGLKSDMEDVYSMMKVFAKEEKRNIIGTKSDFSTLVFEKKIANLVIVENEKNERIGYVLWCFNFSSDIGKPGFYIEDIYIKPGFRNKGIGTRLFKFCVLEAHKENCCKLECLTFKDNTKANKFYKKFGGEIEKDLNYYYLGPNAIERIVKRN